VSDSPGGEPPGTGDEPPGPAGGTPTLCRHCGEPRTSGSAACPRCGTVVSGAAKAASPGVVLGAIAGGIFFGFVCSIVALVADLMAAPHALAVSAVFVVTALLIGLCLVAGVGALRRGRQAFAFFLISTGAVAGLLALAFGVLTLSCANVRWN